MKNPLVIIALFAASSIAPPLHADGKPRIAVSIALNAGNDSPSDGSVASLDVATVFHVVITNISNKPVDFGKEEVSEGYDKLSFIFAGKHGGKWIIKKTPKDWFWNPPLWWIVQPGDSLVIDVKFGSQWENRPPHTSDGYILGTLQAIYDFNEAVASKPKLVRFYR